MNTFHMFGFFVLMHVTGITLVAILFVWLTRRRSALRHTVGVISLILALTSPILVLILPQTNLLHVNRLSKVNAEWDLSKTIIDGTTFRDFEAVFPAIQEVAPNENTVSSEAGPVLIDKRNSPAMDFRRNLIFVTLVNIFWGTWCLGSGLAVYRLCKLRRRVKSLSNSWTPLSPSRFDQVEDDIRMALKLDRLPLIRVAELAPTPMVIGVLKPAVVLPQEFVETADDERLRDVLIHECAHIVRRDPWFHGLQQAAAALFWMHPGIHCLNQQISRAREELCDNFVIRQGGAIDYAQTLLVLSEFCGRQRYAATALGLFTSDWTLEERIRDLLDLKRTTTTRTRWGTKLGLSVLLGLISVLIGGPGLVGVSSADQQTETSKTLKVEEPPDKTPDATKVPKLAKIILQGKCVDDDDNAIPNAAIRVYRYGDLSEPPIFVAGVQSDADGRFKLVNVETAKQDMWDLMLTAKAAKHASAFKQIIKHQDDDEIELHLSSNPQSLSGIVTDVNAQPIPNVFVTKFAFYPPPDILSAVTDERGRYEITDATEWIPQDRQEVINGQVLTHTGTRMFFQFRHPDFALTMAYYTQIPQEVNVTLKPPAIIEGRVIDATTNQPVPNVTVSAQGVARHGGFQTKTDGNGHYRLRMTKDHYNIWAEMDERIAIAVKAIEAVPGATSTDADIQMVRGGFVVGRFIDGSTNEPIMIPEGKTRYVAHYGPARPRTGAAVATTKVNSDGTYRLRVAPGLNYVYLMGSNIAEYITVEDGEEVEFDFVNGTSTQQFQSDPDRDLRSELIRKAQEEDADEAAANEK